MKNIILLVCLCSFFSSSILAQGFDGSNMIWAEESPLKDIGDLNSKQIYTTENHRQVFVDIQFKDAIIDVFDTNVKHTHNKKFNLKYNKKKVQIHFSHFAEDIVYLVGFYYNKKKKHHTIVSQGININTLEYTSKSPKYWDLDNSIDIVAVRKSTSPDNSKFALLLRPIINLKRRDLTAPKYIKYIQKTDYSIFVFDNKMQMIWKEVFKEPKTIVVNKNECNVSPFNLFITFFIDNKGRIIFLYKKDNFEEVDLPEDEMPLLLCVLEKNKKEIKHHIISVSNDFFEIYPDDIYYNRNDWYYNHFIYYQRHFYEKDFTVSNQNEFIITYWKKNQSNIAEKIYVHKISIDTGEEIKTEKKLSLNRTKESLIIDNETVDDKTMEEFSQNRSGFNDGILSYYVKEIKTNEKGEILVIAEQNIDYFTQKTNNTRTDNLLVFKVNSNGDLIWSKKISKKQKGANMNMFSYKNTEYGRDYSGLGSGISRSTTYITHVSDRNLTSFVSFWIKDKVIILYNEHPDKFENKNEDAVFKGIKGNPVIVEIDAEGNISKSLLYKNEEQKMFLVPALCNQINENQLNLFWKEGYADDLEYKISKLTFEGMVEE